MHEVHSGGIQQFIEDAFAVWEMMGNCNDIDHNNEGMQRKVSIGYF